MSSVSEHNCIRFQKACLILDWDNARVGRGLVTRRRTGSYETSLVHTPLDVVGRVLAPTWADANFKPRKV